MLRSCLTCGHPFGDGRLAELPAGVRFAYGPDKGRLWLVCERCGAWSLVPIEARWEALEVLEREVRDRGKVLAATEHVTLLGTDELEIIRVGPAPRAEQAWWRFGERLRTRRARYRRLSRANTALSFLLMPDVVLFSLSLNRDRDMSDRAPRLIQAMVRRATFGRHAWRGAIACGSCGRSRDRLSFSAAESVRLASDGAGDPVLVWECGRCRVDRWGWAGPRRLPGAAGERPSLPAEETAALLRRYLKRANFRGASEAQIGVAAGAIAGAGDADGLLHAIGRRKAALADLRPGDGIALEMALSESWESRWLALEAAEAERQWRRAEELAAIIDGEL
jgi:hypothetical protein